jgi:hypothetical protein
MFMTLDDCRRFYSREIRFAANITSSALIEAYARVPRDGVSDYADSSKG